MIQGVQEKKKETHVTRDTFSGTPDTCVYGNTQKSSVSILNYINKFIHKDSRVTLGELVVLKVSKLSQITCTV